MRRLSSTTLEAATRAAGFLDMCSAELRFATTSGCEAETSAVVLLELCGVLDFLLRGLAKSPGSRFQSVRVLANRR